MKIDEKILLGFCKPTYFNFLKWYDFFYLSASHKTAEEKTLTMTNMTIEKKEAKRALIIEDESDMCLLLNIMLTNDEVELDHVKNLASAKDYLQKENPAVVILDNKLPDGFGIDFISFIKENNPTVKIIMISGYDASAEDVAIENGADVFLPKPFTKQQLYNSMMSLLN